MQFGRSGGPSGGRRTSASRVAESRAHGNSRNWCRRRFARQHFVIVKPVLLLVDLQNDFLRRSGLVPHPASVVTAAANLLAACRFAGVPIVHVWSTVTQEADNRMLHW